VESELLGGLGHHGVAVVVEPIDQGPDRRIFLVLDKGGIIERAYQGAFRGEELLQAFVIDVETKRPCGREEIRPVDEECDLFGFVELEWRHT
jgi:hypothetical protein